MHITKNNVVTFDSTADLLANMKPSDCHRGSLDWCGGIDANQAFDLLREGDLSQVAEAEKLVQMFSVEVETAVRSVDIGCAGFAPNVPDYLGGSPEAMFCMGEEQSTLAPLTIAVNLSCSGNIDAKAMRKRGTAILAVTLGLSAVRPVSLELVGSYGTARRDSFGDRFCGFSMKVQSSPLDLATACYVLAHVGFTRRIAYGAGEKWVGFDGGWPSISGLKYGDQTSMKSIAEHLKRHELDPETTLYIPGASAYDGLNNEPHQWVRSILNRYSGCTVAEANAV